MDSDGKDDTLFLASDANTVGIRTASGATFSIKFSVNEASEVGAEAFTTSDGNSVILLSGSRTAYLFAVKDCHIVVTDNAQGQQYTFDNGFRQPGTGVGCYKSGQGQTLAGLAAVPTTGGHYTVRRTAIVLEGGGISASNGRITTSETYLTKDHAYDAVRNQFSCTPAKI